MKITPIEIDCETDSDLYEGSAFTCIGINDPEEWFEDLNKEMSEEGIGSVDEMFTFKGKSMNKYYRLEGDHAYPDDLTFLSFHIDKLDRGKLAMYKLRIGARWFDDIVDNNHYHMKEDFGSKYRPPEDASFMSIPPERS